MAVIVVYIDKSNMSIVLSIDLSNVSVKSIFPIYVPMLPYLYSELVWKVYTSTCTCTCTCLESTCTLNLSGECTPVSTRSFIALIVHKKLKCQGGWYDITPTFNVQDVQKVWYEINVLHPAFNTWDVQGVWYEINVSHPHLTYKMFSEVDMKSTFHTHI